MPDPSSFRGMVDMRDGSPVPAGTHRRPAAPLVTPWHTHDLHELICASEGTLQILAGTAEYRVGPQQAAWIPAGCEHRATARRASTDAVFFSPGMVAPAGEGVRVFTLTSLAREMTSFATRWPVDRRAHDPQAEAFFVALGLLSAEWIAGQQPLELPVSGDPVVHAVMEYTRQHLPTVQLSGACRAAAISDRALRRRFRQATGLTWQEYRLRARLLSAARSLTSTEWTVAQIAHEVGFDSVSAFTRAFTRAMGCPPHAYRQSHGLPSATRYRIL